MVNRLSPQPRLKRVFTCIFFIHSFVLQSIFVDNHIKLKRN